MRIDNRENGLLLLLCALTLCAVSPACALGSPDQVDEQVVIETDDTSLYAEIRGRNENAPLLLYLHGGPGSPLGVPIFRAYGGRLLEDHFVVVYLHQRGVLKSPRVPDSGHRVERYVQDVHRVVEYLRREFPGRELSLLGHSWGGALAYLYLSHHQGAVHKLVTVSTPVDAESMIHGRVEMTLRWARETENQEAIRDLSPLMDKSVVDHAGDFEVLAKWTTRAYGGWARRLSRSRVDAAGEYRELIPVGLKEQKRIEELMRAELLRLDLREEIKEIDLPLLCVVGRDDVDVPWYLVQEQIRSYGGRVEFEIFEDSHHMPFIDEEELFAETVVRFLQRGQMG